MTPCRFGWADKNAYMRESRSNLRLRISVDLLSKLKITIFKKVITWITKRLVRSEETETCIVVGRFDKFRVLD